jgi:type IV pilus assembly protein PilY1
MTIPSGVTTDAERANYLNWFYNNELAKVIVTSTRLATAQKAAASWVTGLKNDIRLGYSTFAPFTNNDSKGVLVLEAIDDLTSAKKTNIISRINATTANAGTPLAESMSGIGRYLATDSSNSNVKLHADKTKPTQTIDSVLPAANLNNGTTWRTLTSGEATFAKNPIQFSCQKSFAVVMTDGLPSYDRNIASPLLDYDGDCAAAPSLCTGVHDMKKAYAYPGGNGGSPSKDVTGAGSDSSDYFDDVTQALFEMDLRPDKRNYLKEASTAKNNLTSYVIGFADPAIDPTKPGVNPLPKEAAIQGGGKFFFAGSESELTGSLTRAFQFIQDQKSSASSVAANSTQYQTNAVLFQALFDSGDWTGNIKAFTLDSEDTNGNGKLDSTTDSPAIVTANEDTNGNGVLDFATIGNIRWEAKDHIPVTSLRKIFTYDAVLAKGIDFKFTSLNAAQKAVFNQPTPANKVEGGKIVDYLRGDQSNEGDAPEEYRPRSTVLGDIINSDPLFVGGQDFGYSSLPEGGSYAAHVSLKKSNLEMLYVGANDGMLHGFQVGVNPSSGVEGDEVFAFMPNAAISKELFGYVTDRNYIHSFFVDGAPQYGDVFYGGAWHTVLVGSMGAGSTEALGGKTGTGGRSLFALDVTNPSGFGVNNVLWEFSNRDDADLGYTFATPSVVRMANGDWAAIFGNGYNSANGKAALYILNIKTGALLGGKAVLADSPATKDNGLSTPTAVDVDGDKITDYIYAGDLKGNLWKFDVTSSDPNQWGVAFSGKPLFVAKDAAGVVQPITTKPGVQPAKSANQDKGVMVYFGTGKYFEEGDHQLPVAPALPQVQSFYGIWDKCDKSNVATCTGGEISGRSLLVEQKITKEEDILALNISVRNSTACPIAYGTLPPAAESGCSSTANRRGWFMDLKSPIFGVEGERAVNTPLIREDSVVFVTLIPLNVTCEPGGKSWLMEVNGEGASFAVAVIDTNRDGKIDSADLALSGMGKKDIMDAPTVIGSGKGGQEKKMINQSSTSIDQILECTSNCNPHDAPEGFRRSWRQLN